MICELCGKEILEGKEFRVFGIDAQDNIVKIHVYCRRCFEELIPAFYKWLNTSQSQPCKIDSKAKTDKNPPLE